MRRKIAGAVGLVAAAAIGALAATSLAGEDSDPVLRDGDLQTVTAKRVATGEAGAIPLRGGGKRGQTLSYVETKPIVVASKSEEAVEVSKCPKGSKAVTGYFATGNPGTFLDLSRPIRDFPRRWAIGAYNDTLNDDQAIFGIVCLNQLK